MLNRLFIVIGVLAILAVGAAFVVPSFIQWGDYRERMEAIAGEVFGAPVTIAGEIDFSLLPQPRLKISDVRVGPQDAPSLAIGGVEAEFSLVDFLRDRYLITKLVLQRPAVAIAVDETGGVVTGIVLGGQVTAANVSVQRAEVADGSITLADARSGRTLTSGNIDGELRMEALNGPFSFQGTADYEGKNYGARVSTTTIVEGSTGLSVFVRPTDGGFSLTTEGVLLLAASPEFTGELTYRQSPPVATDEVAVEDAGRGDLVLAGKLAVKPSRILMQEYALIPDENRTASRLTGSASLDLGASPLFKAVVFGGLISLPPRDATADQTLMPYELTRLLAELPAVPTLGVNGTINVSINELDLRAFSLRNVGFDATSITDGWRIEDFSADIGTGTDLELDGELTTAAGLPNFIGTVKLASRRLDSLAQLWRRPVEGNPLFNVAGSLEAQVALVGETLSVDGGVLTLDGSTQSVEAEIGFGGASRHLNVFARIGELTPAQSRALAALLPDLSTDAAFGNSFPKGKFDVAATSMSIADLPVQTLFAQGTWDGGVLLFDQLSAEDFGGASFDAKLTAFGSVRQPELSGTVSVEAASADLPAVERLLTALNASPGVRVFSERLFPANISLRLNPPDAEGGQDVLITGTAGAAKLSRVAATLSEGILGAFTGPLSVAIDITSDDADAFTAQLGLDSFGLLPPGSARLSGTVQGSPSNSLAVALLLKGGADEIGLSGNVLVSDPDELSGNGQLRFSLSEPTALAEAIGVTGIPVPAVNGSAVVDFAGLDSITLESITAASGGQPVTGLLTLSRTAGLNAIAGTLNVGSFDAAGLFGIIAGRTAVLPAAAGLWPDGPFDTGTAPRSTTGRIAITSPSVTLTDKLTLSDVRFDLFWDQTEAGVRELTGSLDQGKVGLDVAVCCAGPLPEKRVSGLLSLDGIPLRTLAPEAITSTINGTITTTAQFDGTGGSFTEVLAQMTGEGTYRIGDIRVERLNPGALGAVGTAESVLEDGDAVGPRLMAALEQGAFTAAEANGSFSIAGGVLRSPNLAVDGVGAQLFGSTTIALTDLALDGGFVMSSLTPSAPDALVAQANAKVVADLEGTLLAPGARLDVSEMVVAAIARANELEVERLQRVQEQDVARQRADAINRARNIALQKREVALKEAEANRIAQEAAARAAAEAEAQRLAEEAAARAAAEEAARLEADAAAERARAEQPVAPVPVAPSTSVRPLDLGLGN